MKQPPKQLFAAKYYPGGTGWLGSVGGCSHSFACFKQAAAANWKKWGQAHFEKHHKGTPVKEASKSDE